MLDLLIIIQIIKREPKHRVASISAKAVCTQQVLSSKLFLENVTITMLKRHKSLG